MAMENTNAMEIKCRRFGCIVRFTYRPRRSLWRVEFENRFDAEPLEQQIERVALPWYVAARHLGDFDISPVSIEGRAIVPVPAMVSLELPHSGSTCKARPFARNGAQANQ